MQRNTELKVVGIGVAVLIVFALGVGILLGNATPAAPTVNATTVPALSASNHVRGDSTSKISVIEYGDFQCPACGAYEPIVEQLTQQYGGRVAFAFRNFPLTQVHQDAEIAAQAAEAAALQGKYWEMHDLLYQKQTEWSNESAATVVGKYFDGYAKSLGLDVTKFDADIQSSAVMSKITADVASANAAAVDHTPTFFINLTQIANPGSVAEFQKDIDAALSAASPGATPLPLVPNR